MANSKTQNAFLFTVNAIFRHDYSVAVEPGSMPRPLVQKKLGEILYLLICSFLLCLSWLLCSRFRKSRRDLWITLYMLSLVQQQVTLIKKMFTCSPIFNVACYITTAVLLSFIKVLLINITLRLSMLNQGRFISYWNRWAAILAMILISAFFIL